MDTHSPTLFRNGKTSTSDNFTSFLHPCSSPHNRIRSIFSLSNIYLGPSYTTSKQNNTPSANKTCIAIYKPLFYQAFNRLQKQLYDEKIARGEKIRSWPLIFEVREEGGLVPEREFRWFIKRGGLFSTTSTATSGNNPKAVTKMPSSCQDIRAALAACLQSSDCVMIQRNKPSDCLRSPLLETMPTQCQQLKKGYGECKRGMVDMRKRFRGNQPIAVSKELEGGEGRAGGQLYAGRPAFESTAHKTDGKEEERDWRELENDKFRKEG